MSQASGEPPVYDIVGVGFGPSNLSLALALAEHNATAGRDEIVTGHFLERQQQFGWHRGMLIEDATMQVSFLKDLVTLRNPASRFSFLCYLRDRGRLVDFINHKTLFPLRVEFHDYFEWCAEQVDDQVTYGRDVRFIEPVTGDDGRVEYFDVVARAGGCSDEPQVLRARNLVLATGLAPNLPEGITAGPRVWHNSDLLQAARTVDADARRFVVVGAGQSAAETTAFLHEKFPRAEICSVFSRFGYSPSDDSPFANRIFDPSAVDEFYGAPASLKQKLMDYHANTNYSVVDLELIEDLYRRSYREQVVGAPRLRWFNAARVADVASWEGGVRVSVESMASGESTVLHADAAVFATGYRPDDTMYLLGPFTDRCARDERGRLRIERDYRVSVDGEVAAGLYLQGGGTEHTHGITSSLLSNNAIRSGEILGSVLRHRDAAAPPERSYAASGAQPV